MCFLLIKIISNSNGYEINHRLKIVLRVPVLLISGDERFVWYMNSSFELPILSFELDSASQNSKLATQNSKLKNTEGCFALLIGR
jgi:hypothetical protein